MVFSSHLFVFVFLPLLIVLYFLIPVRFRHLRNNLLLLFSLVFYGWSRPKYLLILFASILINWLAGVLISRKRGQEGKKYRTIILIITVAMNCLIFGYFKYTDFVIQNLNGLLHTRIHLRNIVLPIGISFYTFQGLSYVIDVYRGKADYLKNPLRVALYISLFPQLVAGPIVRFGTIAGQIEDRHENLNDAADGAQRFILGLAKKIILADTFGIIANGAFGSSALTVSHAWLGAVAYAFQIYFDFSGYSDMAIGLGRIFGFSFPENFNYPYISHSVTEFWRRWHMTLSTWFRDYVYIPLGGNRCGKARHILNIVIVWALTGLWHGASWNFVLWGLYYCVWLIIDKYVVDRFRSHIPKPAGMLLTFLIVLFGWVLFRADNLSKAIGYIGTMFGAGGAGMGGMDLIRYTRNYWLFWIVGIIAVTPLPAKLAKKMERKPSAGFLIGKYIFLLLVFGLSVLYIIGSTYNAFIYFQF